MKIDKEKAKEIKGLIKVIAKEMKMKTIGSSLYMISEDNIIVCNYLIIEDSIIFTVGLKKVNYDEVLWDILDMRDNVNQPISLRVRGAYTCPFIKISKGIFLYGDESQKEMIKDYLYQIETVYRKFVAENDIIEYIQHMGNTYHLEVLKCCALIGDDRITEACEFAKSELEKGESGGFIVGDKSFYQLLLDKYM